MISNRRRRFLEDSALREAQKAFRARGRNGTRPADFFALRMQTVEPWKRVGAMLVGAFFAGMAWWALEEEFSFWAIGAFAGIGVICVFVGAIGWKRPVEAVLDATADVLFRRLLDCL
ncbi:hypothetical protein [Opitutus terrae]|uniref:Uncharacterized protein n=1 Tax=Opitutus terrae (strain DSM 11246 / JCM 15787 / PB90-1) TaxID=452637 RepID=B1ZWD4_OPITP|nr:hypothetical protein [Opitutus terrae]ACB76886.1 hypothetical protein Oter_3609 [Opitutus terrae PB90-1]